MGSLSVSISYLHQGPISVNRRFQLHYHCRHNISSFSFFFYYQSVVCRLALVCGCFCLLFYNEITTAIRMKLLENCLTTGHCCDGHMCLCCVLPSHWSPIDWSPVGQKFLKKVLYCKKHWLVLYYLIKKKTVHKQMSSLGHKSPRSWQSWLCMAG